VPTLVLSSRHTADDQALWRAAIARGWSVERVRGVEVPAIADPEVALYLEALFAPVIAERLGVELVEPPEDWLVALPEEARLRRVVLTTLGEARRLDGPIFVKPPNDKSFRARVYAGGSALPAEYDDAVTVLVAEPVQWRAEYRCFYANGAVRAASPYLLEGEHASARDYQAPPGELEIATRFVERLLRDPRVAAPPAIVIDVGIIADRGWAVVEANGAWGSGIYGCDPDGVLDVVRRATVREIPGRRA
jgi:hypothetical protein